jgi:hypothetical protein
MKKKRVIQGHHLVYPSPDHPEQEWKVPIFKGEHEISSKMQLYTRKSVSRGFITWLKYFIVRNEDRAIDLNNIGKEE